MATNRVRRFLQQLGLSDKSVKGAGGLSVHQYVLSFYILLVLLLSDQSRPPIRGKPNFEAFLYTVAY